MSCRAPSTSLTAAACSASTLLASACCTSFHLASKLLLATCCPSTSVRKPSKRDSNSSSRPSKCCWPSRRRASRSPRWAVAADSSMRKPSSLASSSTLAVEAAMTSRCKASNCARSASAAAFRCARPARTSSETSFTTSALQAASFWSKRWTTWISSPTSCLVAEMVAVAPANSSEFCRCRVAPSPCKRCNSEQVARVRVVSSACWRWSSVRTASNCRNFPRTTSLSCSTVLWSSSTVPMTRSTVMRASERERLSVCCCFSASLESASTMPSSRA
mmetsp:Transcript_110512/g.319356  ORF Transcript_110512/g.319356 Transcript_110512/m.319356 type:complete len:275 (+) Transcript_110512:220-1044(+)